MVVMTAYIGRLASKLTATSSINPLQLHGYPSGWISDKLLREAAQAVVAFRNQLEVDNGVLALRLKGRVRDQVTESSCGCFLASTIHSQWLSWWCVGSTVGGVLGACGTQREKGLQVRYRGGGGCACNSDKKSCRCQNVCVLRAAMVQMGFM
jgi:hypothetical protein